MLIVLLLLASIIQLCLPLCDPTDCSMPGFPVHHRLPEFAQTHVHWVGHEWCHPTISSSVALFSSWVQSFPASGSFPMSWLFTTGGQNIGASASVFPVNIQGWFPLVLTGLKSLQSKQLSRVFSSTTNWKHQFFSTQPSLWSNSHIHTWLLWTSVSKVMSLLLNMLSRFVIALLNMLSRFVIAFLPRASIYILTVYYWIKVI